MTTGSTDTGAGPSVGRRAQFGVPSNLPAELSSFVGRRADLDRGVVLLGRSRLLTLTGAGGCGKTRVAQRLAALVADGYPDGVWWVELAALTDGALVAESLARAIGLPVTGTAAANAVVGHLVEARALVVLDNCEHLLDPVAVLVGRLLRDAPEVRVLCTSRQPVGVEGETSWRIPSLAVPPLAADPETLSEFDAAALFLTRAVQANPDLTLPVTGAVAQICRRLDGIPLALELAAARTRTLPMDRIVAELDDRFRLLTGGARAAVARHRTLLASVEWSHDLLDPSGRAVLRRLGVFVGGFDIEAATDVAGLPPLERRDVLEQLTLLVDKSLVQLDATGRYQLLETIRVFATNRLAEAGETRAIADRHLGWAVALAEQLEPDVDRADVSALDRLELDVANLRAALGRAAAVALPDHAGLRLVASLPLFWANRGWAIEGMQRGGPVLAANPDAPLALRARARWAVAYDRLWGGGDFAGAAVEARQALAEAVEAGDTRTQGRCLRVLALADQLQLNPAAARETASRAVALSRSAGDRSNEAHLLAILVMTYLVQYQLITVGHVLAEAGVIADATDDAAQKAWHHVGTATVAAAAGRFDDARHAYLAGIDAARRIGDPVIETYSVAGLTNVELATGRWDEIARIGRGMGRPGRPLEPVVHAGLVPALQEIATLGQRPAHAAAVLAATGEMLLTRVDPVAGMRALHTGAVALLRAGEAAGAQRIAEAALQTCDRIGSAFAGPCRVLLARLERRAGEAAAAERLVHQALLMTLDAGLLADIPDALEVLGGIAVDAGSAAEGARLLAAAASLSAEMGRYRFFAAEADADRGSATEALGAEFDRVWQEGARLDATAAVAYARRARGERRRPQFGWDALTPTELEVVGLVAAGLSNPSIAERLFIARSTVKTHLLHIFAKLGVSNRTELAAATLRRGGT